MRNMTVASPREPMRGRERCTTAPLQCSRCQLARAPLVRRLPLVRVHWDACTGSHSQRYDTRLENCTDASLRLVLVAYPRLSIVRCTVHYASDYPMSLLLGGFEPDGEGDEEEEEGGGKGRRAGGMSGDQRAGLKKVNPRPASSLASNHTRGTST